MCSHAAASPNLVACSPAACSPPAPHGPNLHPRCSAPEDVKPTDIESAIRKYEDELDKMGIDLKDLIKKKK